ncbi:hypothetical protein ANTQUA_LOCUS2280 [Anthophora quadrimaculata]
MREDGQVEGTEPPEVPDIREATGQVEARRLQFCLDPLKKVNKDQTAIIIQNFREMRSLMEELLLLNNFLEEKLEQATGGAKKQQAFAEAIAKTVQATRRLESAAKRTVQDAIPSYADRLKMCSPEIAPSTVELPRNIVVIYPDKEESKIRTSEEARDAVFTLVNSRKRSLQVKAIRRAQGNGVGIETETTENLKAFTENSKLTEAGLRTKTHNQRMPRVVIYDVPRGMSSGKIQTSLRKQNAARITKEDAEEVKFCIKTETSPSTARGAQRLAVIAPHKGTTQKVAQPLKYANCVHAGKRNAHTASSKNCPTYRAALERIVSSTRYE